MSIQRRARYNKIEAMVDALLAQHDQTRPPVRIEKIAKGLGVEVRGGDLGEISGLIVRSGTGAIIGVNSTQGRQRQRFTIAHELGHFLLHEGLVNHVDRNYRINYRSAESSLATNVEEIEANFFAASILMPRRFLDGLNADEAVEDDEKVAELARTFDVSRHAMSLRLVNLYEEFAPF
jgi:Zn-dependent peptidase ImmA (M78 family)